LYSRVHPGRSSDYDAWYAKWKWQYQENPYGKSRIWLAVDDGRVVGQYPTIFWKMKMRDEVVMSVQNIDLMTDPDIRSPGQFLRLEKTAIDAFNDSSVRLIWGFPNESVLSGHIKSGYRKFGQYSMLFRVLNPLNLFLGEPHPGHRRKTPYNLERVSKFDERCNTAVEEFNRSKDLTTAREIDFLNWRYPESGGFQKYYSTDEQNVDGYFVYKIVRAKGLRIGMLFDMVYTSNAELKRTVKGLCRLCSQDHAMLAISPAMVNKQERKELLRAGLSNFVFYDRISFYVMMLPDRSQTDPTQFHDMHFTLGDLDYNG